MVELREKWGVRLNGMMLHETHFYKVKDDRSPDGLDKA